MKRPFQWWRAIAPAACDAMLPLVGLVAYFATLTMVVRSIIELRQTRPIAAITFSLVWLVVGMGVLVALRLRVLRLVGVIRLWRRQRRGV